MKKRILIVDDHADFRTMVKDYINRNKLGVEVFEASTGEMGVVKASFVKPDIILMDINLPQTNGLEAAKCVKEDHPHADIIILTTFDVGAFRKAAEKIKVRDFIGKHDVYDCLLPAIKKCLETKTSHNSKRSGK